jgi:hypothetical protein
LIGKNLRTKDVTDRVVDLDAQILTLVATEEELRALLAESRQQARDVEEIMAVYRELTSIRSKIEGLQAQLESLNSQVAFSRIDVGLRPTASSRPAIATGWRPADTARGSFRTLTRVLQALVDLGIFLVVVAVPVGTILVALAWLVRRFWRTLKVRARQPASDDDDGSN